jgi:signal transduction histidine kinase
MNRLVQDARGTAAARQREAAAARSEKLTVANALLRETSERLGAVEDLDIFLGRVLLAICEATGGHSASLWLVDPQDPTHYRLHHVVEDGRVVAGAQSSHPQRETGSTLEDRARFDPHGYGPGAKPVQIDVATGGGLHPNQRAYLLGMGVRSLVSVPLVLGDRSLGDFFIRLTDDRRLVGEDLDLVQALAGQAAVAVNLARLAEAAKQVAVAEEREAAERSRADALHRANEVLRTLIERLSEQQDLTAFLGEALTIGAREMGAVGAGVWIRLESGTHGLLISSEAGKIRAPVDDEYISRTGIQESVELELSRGEIGFVPASVYAKNLEDRDPELMNFYEVQKIVAIVSVPMFVGDRLIGTITLRHTSETLDYPPERAELALAFANQIALALEMQRLAEAAREAARAEERALAARQRTEAAERTAETLRASLDLLAAEPELERFLGHVLRAANAQLDVRRSRLWLHDQTFGVSRLHMSCDDGRITVDPGEGHGLPTVVPPGNRRFWRTLIEEGGPITYDDAANNPDISEIASAMRLHGVRSLLLVPLMLGAQILGVVAIHNTERASWTEDEVNLAKALGHQATLALQLTRLATEARESAVLQERNRLAREIHDTLAQGFAAIRLQLELARGEPDVPAKTGEALDVASQIAAENLIEARRSMAVLISERPSMVASLSAAIEGVRRLGQTQVVAEMGSAPEPPPNVAHELLRICQEAMLNAVRHAEASTLRITLAAVPGGGVRIAVTDDGKGFDSAVVAKGFGLAGLRDRANAINADLTIVSEPGGGTEVIATWAPA